MYFGLAEGQHALVAALAAEARLLHPAERSGGVGHHALVDARPSRPRGASATPHAAAEVAGVDVGHQAVARRRWPRRPPRPRCRRSSSEATGPKISSASDRRVGGDLGDHGGLVEVALRRAGGRRPPVSTRRRRRRRPARAPRPSPGSAASTSGPSCGVRVDAGPDVAAPRAMAVASRRRTPSATGASTKKRLAAVQVSPLWRSLAIIAPSTAASRSASANTRNGALPPSSIEQLTMRSAACASSTRPTSVDPVKLSFRTRSSAEDDLGDAAGVARRDDVARRPPARRHRQELGRRRPR